MKNEQEQIEEMAHIMCEYYNSGFCANSDMTEICEDMPDCCYKNEAEALYNAGYGDVSEYKAEIERLRTTLGECNTELNSALESLKSQCREIGELKAGTKQAKIDVLNRVMTYINDKIENDYGDMSDSVQYLTINIDDFDDFIDELIKEVQNA